MESTQTLTYRCPHCQAPMDVHMSSVDQTVECAQCGKPFRADAPSAVPVAEKSATAGSQPRDVAAPFDEERVLETVHPAMFRNHPFLYLGAIGLLFLGFVGLLVSLTAWEGAALGAWNPGNWGVMDGATLRWASAAMVLFSGGYLLVWWIQTRFASLQITTERSVFQRGLIARKTSDVRHRDVRNLQIDQTFLGRLLRVGTIGISSAGQDDFEIRAKGIPSPEKLGEIIRRYQ